MKAVQGVGLEGISGRIHQVVGQGVIHSREVVARGDPRAHLGEGVKGPVPGSQARRVSCEDEICGVIGEDPADPEQVGVPTGGHEGRDAGGILHPGDLGGKPAPSAFDGEEDVPAPTVQAPRGEHFTAEETGRARLELAIPPGLGRAQMVELVHRSRTSFR